jgi:hypothetical protein
VDSEPRGHTIDGTPWEEPRPPHLPDRLMAVSPWVLPFLVVVVAEVWLFSITGPRSDSLDWLSARYGVTGLLGSLVGLALFLRHPDARVTLPQIASGAFLLLLQQVMVLLEPAVGPVLRDLTEPSDNLFSSISPMHVAYRTFTSIIGIFGIAFIASGMSAARRHKDIGAVRGLAAVLTIMTVASAAPSILWITEMEFDDSLVMVVMTISSAVVRLFETLAVSFLVVASLSGWLGLEEPRSGWRLATIGAGLILLQLLLAPFVWSPPLSQDDAVALIAFMAVGAVIGWVLLVIAFALGLPSTVPISDDDTDEAELLTPDRPAVTTPGSAAG